MKKSSRHPKITGDFAEAFVLYWLSKHGYECARVNHTGIDLIARCPDSSEVMGISVKCRSRYAGTETGSINLPRDGFIKAEQACQSFGCVAYYAVMVDWPESIRCFLVSLEHLKSLFDTDSKKMPSWQMTAKWLEKYRLDPHIKQFELKTVACSWRDTPGIAAGFPNSV